LLLERAAGKKVSLTATNLARDWQLLAEDNARKAYQVICELASAPADSVPWIKGHLKPQTPVAGSQIERLMEEVDNNSYLVRQKATDSLAYLRQRALPRLTGDWRRHFRSKAGCGLRTCVAAS
jgi:hypothetical protein